MLTYIFSNIYFYWNFENNDKRKQLLRIQNAGKNNEDKKRNKT